MVFHYERCLTKASQPGCFNLSKSHINCWILNSKSLKIDPTDLGTHLQGKQTMELLSKIWRFLIRCLSVKKITRLSSCILSNKFTFELGSENVVSMGNVAEIRKLSVTNLNLSIYAQDDSFLVCPQGLNYKTATLSSFILSI